MAMKLPGLPALPLYALVVTALFEVSAARGAAACVPFLTVGLLALVGIWHARRAASESRIVAVYVDAAAAAVLVSVLVGLAFGRVEEATRLANHAAQWSPAFAAWWFGSAYRSWRGPTLRSVAFTGVLILAGSEGLTTALKTSLLTVIVVLAVLQSVPDPGRSLRPSRRRHAGAMHDAMTGLASLQAFESELAQLAAISDRYGVPVTMLVVRIADSGSTPQDAGLIHFAEQLYRRIRTADTACYAGGGDFYVLLPNTMPEGAQQIADDIATSSASMLAAEGRAPELEVLVEQHCAGEDPMCMVERAERRFAVAKQR